MKKTIFILLLFSIIIVSCDKEKLPIAGITVKFEGVLDSEGIHAWIIETARNDTATHLDTIEYGQISHTNAYSIFLRFKEDTENGDYLIFADSIKHVNIISDVEVRFEGGHYKYTFLFNGIPKNNENKEDVFLTITR